MKEEVIDLGNGRLKYECYYATYDEKYLYISNCEASPRGRTYPIEHKGEPHKIMKLYCQEL